MKEISNDELQYRVGLKIKLLLAHLTQKAVAKRLHVSEVQLSRFLNGTADLPARKVKRIETLCRLKGKGDGR